MPLVPPVSVYPEQVERRVACEVDPVGASRQEDLALVEGRPRVVDRLQVATENCRQQMRDWVIDRMKKVLNLLLLLI